MGKLASLRGRQSGRLDPGVIQAGTSLEAIWSHITEGLRSLAEDRDALPHHENGLTQELVDRLEQRAGHRPYYFQREDLEDVHDGNSRRLDIAGKARNEPAGTALLESVGYASRKRFLAMEAKRLPAPPPKAREREYVVGEHGGIERFKRGRHGEGLRMVGMIGYLQRENTEHWLSKINAWIEEEVQASRPECPWDDDDKLRVETASEGVSQLRSSNHRTSDATRITIRHLWVNLT
jgi:hypothetical protein